MISGLLKLMCCSSSTVYQVDLKVPFKRHCITADNLASRRARRAWFWLDTSLSQQVEETWRIWSVSSPLDCIMMYNVFETLCEGGLWRL
jgi:hypothetical protein